MTIFFLLNLHTFLKTRLLLLRILYFKNDFYYKINNFFGVPRFDPTVFFILRKLVHWENPIRIPIKYDST